MFDENYKFYLDLYETDTINEKMPILFEKGISLSVIAESLSEGEFLEFDGEKIPITLDAADVAITILYHYIVREKVSNAQLLCDPKYHPLIDALGDETFIRCLSTTVTKIGDCLFEARISPITFEVNP